MVTLEQLESRIKNLEQKAATDKLEIQTLKSRVQSLEIELAKIRVRDIFKAYAELFSTTFGKHFIGKTVNLNNRPAQSINFSLPSNISHLISKLHERTNVAAIKELEEFAKENGFDPLAMAEYIHNITVSDAFNQYAHPLMKYLRDVENSTEELKNQAEKVLQTLTPTSKEKASQILDVIVKEGFSYTGNLGSKSKKRPIVQASSFSSSSSSSSSASPLKKLRKKN